MLIKYHTLARELKSYLDEHEIDIFSKKEIKSIFSEVPNNELDNALRKVIDNEPYERIENGKYCRATFVDEFVIGSFLVKEGGIAYWSAMNFYGLTEQIPNIMFVQTSQKKANKRIFGVKYVFVQVAEPKVTGYAREGYGNHQFRITDIEKTVLDSFDQPQHSGGYEEIIKAFAKAEINPYKLIQYAQAVNNISVIKRLAYLGELINKSNFQPFLDYAMTVRNDKYNLFEYDGFTFGKTNRKWRLVINMSEEEILGMAAGL